MIKTANPMPAPTQKLGDFLAEYYDRSVDPKTGKITWRLIQHDN